MGAFLKVILVILGIYLIGKLIVRKVVSYLLGGTVRNMDMQLRRQQEETVRKKTKQEGKVTINYQPKQDKNFGEEEGDYVDFEEVK